MLTFKSPLVGESPAIQEIFSTVQKIAQSDSTVLITGESGTGKELVARAIHENSARASGPWVVVNCSAIPSELLEAELFGYVKGAFTGATQNRIGRFELANGGSLFLDEIGDVPLHLQVKLLRVLQTKQFEAVGSNKTVTADVRIIAATNVNLELAVKNKIFREDLYYRLNVIPVRVPALRERKADIAMLTEHFITRFNRLTGHNVETPKGDVMDAFMAYDWPGNIRELENLMERMVILKQGGTIELAEIPQQIFSSFAAQKGSDAAAPVAEWEYPRMMLPTDGLDLKNIVAAFENHLVDQALARTHGNKNKASELLKMNRTTLVEKLRKRGMIIPAKHKLGMTGNDGGNFAE